MDTSELDQAIYKATLRAHSKADQQILQQITTGAGWVGEDLARIGQRTANKCLLCGAIEENAQHGLWFCPPVKQRRLETELDHLSPCS